MKSTLVPYVNIPKSEIHVLLESWLSEMITKKTKTVLSILFCDSCHRFDNLVLMNKDSTKLITTLNVKTPRKNATSDEIRRIVGKKIDKKWYFFMGSTLIVPHSSYHYDKYNCLSFLELSYVARSEFLTPFYKIVDNKIVVNDKQVEEYVIPSRIIGTQVFDEELFEKAWMDGYNHRLERIVPLEEYTYVKADIESSVRPPTEIEGLPWWDKLKGKKPPLFERSEWKKIKRDLGYDEQNSF